MYKRILLTFTLVIGILSFLLAACASSKGEQELSNEAVLATMVEQTVQARVKTQLAQPADKTATPAATKTSTPIQVDPTQLTSPGCLVAGLVSETIPDGTVLQKGAAFTKTWKVINGGTCSWSTAFKLVFVGGDILGAPYEINLIENVAPGNVTNISVSMVAPNTDANYTGYWMLKTNAGMDIAPFTVNIIVGNPLPSSFQVTKVTAGFRDMVPMSCPHTDSFNVDITTNGAGTVTYFFEDNISGVGATKSLNFTSASTLTLEYWITISRDGDYWVLVYINNPNQQYFGPFNFNVNCPPYE
jgi:hypothetical protein